MELEQALAIVKAAGYRVSKPRRKVEPSADGRAPIETVNPYGHPFPHAKLRNVTLTSINRLRAPNSFRFVPADWRAAGTPWERLATE